MNVDYLNPDYAPILSQRGRLLQEFLTDPQLFEAAKVHYEAAPWQFISDWGMTVDPRNVDVDLPAMVPFVLWPRQVEFLQWLDTRWRAQERGLVEKSRDCGVSWLSVGYACTRWLFNPGFVAGFGSRKSEYVDKRGDMRSLFEKARAFLDALPTIFLPGGWNPQVHCTHMLIVNPENGSSIVGESGDSIGRGARASLYVVDEAQTLSSKILTPSGWKTMGEMAVGAEVIGPDGGTRKVIGINDAGVHDVYRIHFSDGTSVSCSPNHLWTVDKVWGGRERLTLRTHEIAETFVYRSPGGQTQYRYRLPRCEPVRFERRRLPLAPYVVGALIGNGHLSGHSVRFSTADAETVSRLAVGLPPGYEVKHGSRYDYTLSHSNGRGVRSGPRRALKDGLADVGLLGMRSWEKRIPQDYLLSCVEDRVELLRGLMDTDGSGSGGRACYVTTSAQLADDVVFLVRSLGGMATQSVKPDPRGFRDCHCVHVAMPDETNPFHVPRKVRLIRERKRDFSKTIVGIERLPPEPVRCITVDAPDGLYVTDGFCVTHNSAHIEHQELADTALSATTNCQIDMSSVNGSGNAFYRKRMKWDGTDRIFVFDYRDDPRKTPEWAAHKQAELEPWQWAQEYERDYDASMEDQFIPGTWVASAIDAHVRLGIPVSGIRVTGFDPADVGDKKAIVNRHGSVILGAKQMSAGDITQAIPWAIAEADAFRADILRYDGDGMGAPTMKLALLTQSVGRMQVMAFHGGGAVEDPDKPAVQTVEREADARTNRDTYENLRAQAWTQVRERFRKTHAAMEAAQQGHVVMAQPDDLISISSQCDALMQLRSELSRPKRMFSKNGKIMVESKARMKARGIESPNLADALVMAVTTRRPPVKKATVIMPERRMSDPAIGY